MLLTDGARKSNWENRRYKPKEIENIRQWMLKQEVVETDEKTGLRQQIENMLRS